MLELVDKAPRKAGHHTGPYQWCLLITTHRRQDHLGAQDSKRESIGAPHSEREACGKDGDAGIDIDVLCGIQAVPGLELV